MLLFSLPALAEENNCRQPAAPILPITVVDEDALNALSAVMDRFSADSIDYLACLAAFADRNQSVLTEPEKVLLENQFRSYKESARSHAAQWREIQSTREITP